MSKYLEQYPSIVQATRSLTSVFQHMDQYLQATVAKNSSSKFTQTSSSATLLCNNPDGKWRSATINYLVNRGFTNPQSPTCITDIFGVPSNKHNSQPYTEPQVHQLITSRGKAITSLAPALLNNISISNWTKPVYPIDHMYTRQFLECTLDHQAALRINGLWYVATGITNRPKMEWVAIGERQYLVEYIRVSKNGKLSPARMVLPINPVNGTMHYVDFQASTLIAYSRGGAQPSQFRPIPLERNVAVVDALDIGDAFVQQIEDATTGSNIAILALPMILTLVPIALVADVSQRSMLLYILLCDILTALPMAIKGAELLSISRRRFTSMVSRMGDTSRCNESVVAEIWVADCGIRKNVGPTGLAFLTASMVLMAVGIALEVFARWWFKDRQTREHGVKFEEENTMIGVDNIDDDDAWDLDEY